MMTAASASPATPSIPRFPEGGILYKLHFAQGSNPNCWLLFNYPGPIYKAIPRARTFCENTGRKFIRVELALFNLDEAEKAYLEGKATPSQE